MTNKYIKLAQGVIALVKLHHADEQEIAEYLMQYVNIKGVEHEAE